MPVVRLTAILCGEIIIIHVLIRVSAKNALHALLTGQTGFPIGRLRGLFYPIFLFY